MHNNELLDCIYNDIICDFKDRKSCEEYRLRNKDIPVNSSPVYSFMMATYNDETLINSAINSLLRQSFTDWELIILDNSDKNDNVWQMIENAMFADKRIKGMRSNENVGWAKAASICLQEAKGIYTTFLAADDCINNEALTFLTQTILDEEFPDIIYVGHANVMLEGNGQLSIIGGNRYEHKSYTMENKSWVTTEIIENVYYNSFFHYMKVEFLKRENIDFFEPYYSDCVGMTRALTKAKKVVVTDGIVYFLTSNTSQTKGRYTWNGYDIVFFNQWKLLKEEYVKEGYGDVHRIAVVARRILINLCDQIQHLCRCSCKNLYMNTIDVTYEQVWQQLECIVSDKRFAEMLRLCGPEEFVLFLSGLMALEEQNGEEQSWLKPLFDLARCKNDNDKQLGLMIRFMKEEKNIHFVGYDYLVYLIKNIDQQIVHKYMDDIRIILARYKTYLQ